MQATIVEPIAALIAEAKKYRTERENNKDNRSIRIDYWNLETIGVWVDFPNGARGAPWCCSYVTAVGRQSLGHAWPVPLTASVQTVVDWAEAKGVLKEEPKRGDLLVSWYSSLGRFGHIAIVIDVMTDGRIKTIEGNTNLDGSREGYGIFERLRSPSDRYKFVRWADVL
jgi:hypothetical protein